jgi:two-component system, cell cycle sensor histidine kinase and response regulator CckA
MTASIPGQVRKVLSSLSLNVKGLLVVSIPVCTLLFAASAFLGYYNARRTARGVIEGGMQTREVANEFVSASLRVDRAVLGYQLTHSATYLSGLRQSRSEIRRMVVTLGAVTKGNPVQEARARKIESISKAIWDAPGAPLGGGPPEVTDKGAALMSQLDSMRLVADEIFAEAQSSVGQAGRTVDAKMAQWRAASVLAGLIGTLGGLAAALFFTRHVVRRLRLLQADARQVAAGEPLALRVTGHDEISVLERVLWETSEMIAQQRAELSRARVELEERVAQRTADLRQSNEDLRQTSELLSVIYGSAPLAIWSTDLKGIVTSWNQGAERVFGWSESEAIGMPLPVLPDSARGVFETSLQRLAGGEPLNAIDLTGVRRDGKLLNCISWVLPLRDATGRIRGSAAITHDVTAHKQLEEQLRQSQKMEAVGRLAGGVAHDFNNLLTAILGYAGLLESNLASPLAASFVGEIQQAATRASALTARLLAFSRRQPAQPRVVDLNQCVTQSLRLVERVIGEDVRIETEFDPAAPPIFADPLNLDQIILNLVINARDAMPQGGRVTVTTAEVDLDATRTGHLMGITPGRFALLSIADTGTGMDEVTRSHLFEPFFTTKEQGKGTGLGLSIVYGIVQQSGGGIEVHSEPGEGSTFRIYLPAASGEPAAWPEAQSGARLGAERGDERLLVCEDEPVIRSLVARMLGERGYRVIEAAGPADAIRIIRSGGAGFDLLITDVVMPGMSGPALAREVRSLQPEMRVMFMSGYSDSRHALDLELPAGSVFLQKPFTAEELGRKVREALGRAATV